MAQEEMPWWTTLSRLIDRLPLNGWLFAVLAIGSGFLHYAPADFLEKLRLNNFVVRFDLWIVGVFIICTLLALVYFGLHAWTWTWRTLKNVRYKKKLRRVMNHLTTIDQQVLDGHFVRPDCKETVIVLSRASPEFMSVQSLVAKGILIAGAVSVSAASWKPFSGAFMVSGWAWEILHSRHYKPKPPAKNVYA